MFYNIVLHRIARTISVSILIFCYSLNAFHSVRISDQLVKWYSNVIVLALRYSTVKF